MDIGGENMKEEKKNNTENSSEDYSCPPIELGIHQNSYNPKNIEKRGENNE